MSSKKGMSKRGNGHTCAIANHKLFMSRIWSQIVDHIWIGNAMVSGATIWIPRIGSRNLIDWIANSEKGLWLTLIVGKLGIWILW